MREYEQRLYMIVFPINALVPLQLSPEASYRLIRRGFWFASGSDLLFYPMPSVEELERDHYQRWKYVN